MQNILVNALVDLKGGFVVVASYMAAKMPIELLVTFIPLCTPLSSYLLTSLCSLACPVGAQYQFVIFLCVLLNLSQGMSFTCPPAEFEPGIWANVRGTDKLC
jgi:hypothetical protein